MTRVYTVIWFIALSLAVACVWLLLSISNDQESKFPGGFPSLAGADIVFIGSSITGHALPVPEPVSGILEDGRSCAVLSVPAITERLSTRLVDYAIDSGAKTLLVEINAYAHEYVDFNEPHILRSLVFGIREAGDRLAINVKSLLNLAPQPKHITDCGAPKQDKTLDAGQLQPQEYYRFHLTEPSHGEALQAILSRAREAGVEVLFFSPPRPQSAINMIGIDEFARLQAHLGYIASTYDVPLWYAATPWPDDHFMDILAHTNERGRIRFQKELADWYEGRQ